MEKSIQFICRTCGHNAFTGFDFGALETSLSVLDVEIRRCYKAIREMEELRMQLQKEMKTPEQQVNATNTTPIKGEAQ